jgi:hypothetical protein
METRVEIRVQTDVEAKVEVRVETKPGTRAEIKGTTGTIAITFDGLCALFTSKPGRLLVGLVNASAGHHHAIHHPLVSIREAGGSGPVKEYREFAEISGDIYLDAPAGTPPLSLRSPNNPQDPQSYDNVVDIEKHLYGGQSLGASASRCGARFHFSGGELSADTPLTAVRFKDANTNEADPSLPTKMAAPRAKLTLTAPAGGATTLRSGDGKINFTFEGGKNYEVLIANNPDSLAGAAAPQPVLLDHFKYFYDLVPSQPERKLIPDLVPPAEQPGGVSPAGHGGPLCMPGGFGNSEY